MGASDPDRGGDRLDIFELFCYYYNALYFHDSLGTCAVSWATDEELLPHRSRRLVRTLVTPMIYASPLVVVPLVNL
ncbi:hypothetical protein GUJ93_ZPchr0013g37757 [Zizania palustris]|uniref:Uncharacterized protein n=1 Tax=Zizania palustris TaxID=103762 RepID=A0A8J5WXU0_ZIZPA|nr:hypothetical protein GUJ93_ZPchr0013g37757 [Zizania palustris]